MKFDFYTDLFTKFLMVVALVFVGHRIENMIEYNKTAIEKHIELSTENLRLNKLQLEKLDEIIKGKL